jgi:ATPase subunit of ABC transporter with duplicated ATPase domains
MIEINFNKVTKNYGYGDVLKNISFEIQTGEIVALIGNNGEGKTTILNLINKDENVTSGQITLRNSSKIGYLKQIVSNDNDLTVIEILKNSLKELYDMEEKLFNYEMKMESLQGEELNNIIVKYSNLQEKFIAKDGYAKDKKLGKIIKGFKLDKLLENKYNTLSGGEKRIVNLASLVLEEPDVLLLDEPTNHLDIDTLEWFEDYLKALKKTVLIVSHDRYFLDRVVNKIIYIEKGEIDIYFGNYSYFEEERERRIMLEFEAYKNEQKKIEAMKESIKRLKEFGRRASPKGGEMFFKRAASIQKRLDKMVPLEKKNHTNNLSLDFGLDRRSGNDVLRIINKDLYIGDRLLINKMNMEINYGDRVCIIGKNGTGKSTLIKYIMNLYKNEIIDDRIKLGSNLHIGYIPQEIVFDNPKETIYEYTRRLFDGEDNILRSKLFNFNFFDDDLLKKIEVLSGGEKVRLKLFELLQKKSNLLLFDEPTNHIDIETRNILEDALKSFKGTILFISHDRYFINKLASKIYEINNNKMVLYLGNYDYYKDKIMKGSNL